MAVLETLVITVGRIGVLGTVVIPIEEQGALVITVKRQLSHYRNYRWCVSFQLLSISLI